MAARIEAFLVTIAAGVAKTAPVATPVTFPDGTLLAVTVTVPPGPSGLMGFQIAQSGVPVIPRTAGTFIIADDRVIRWETHDYPQGGRYSIIGYNTDVNPHAIQIEFELDELSRAASVAIPIVPIEPPATPVPGQQFTTPGQLTPIPESITSLSTTGG